MRTRSQTEQHSASSKNSTIMEGNMVSYGMLENYYFDPFQRHINLIKRKNVQNPKNKHNKLFIFQLSCILT